MDYSRRRLLLLNQGAMLVSCSAQTGNIQALPTLVLSGLCSRETATKSSTMTSNTILTLTSAGKTSLALAGKTCSC